MKVVGNSKAKNPIGTVSTCEDRLIQRKKDEGRALEEKEELEQLELENPSEFIKKTIKNNESNT